MSRSKYIPRVLPLGDSLVWGFGSSSGGFRSGLYAAAQAAGAPIFMVGNTAFNNPPPVRDPYNCGANGATIAGILGDFGPDLSGDAADVTFMEGGTNDIALGANAATVLASWANYIQSVGAWNPWPWHKIIVSEIWQVFPPQTYNAVVQQVNAGLPAVIAASPFASRITLFPAYGMIPQADYNADGLHPTNTGYGIVATNLWTYLAPLVADVQASQSG